MRRPRFCAWNAAPTRAEDGAAPAEWKGTIRGQVVDSKRGTPVGYATVTLIWPAPADGGEPRREQQVADPNGGFEFAAVPAGIYTLSFSKTGYQTSTLIELHGDAGAARPRGFPASAAGDAGR